MAKMNKVSPSLIGMLLECPRCLWLHYNEEVKRPRGIFPSLPGGMDEILKDYFDTYRGKGELPPEIKGEVEDAVLYSKDSKSFNKWRDIDFGRGGLSAKFPKLNMILRGAIDELLVDSSGKFIPFDFKTRGYPTKKDTHEHYQHQLDLYALLFRENGFEPASVGYLLFFWPKKYEKGGASFDTDLVKMSVDAERGMDTLKEAHQIITGEKPESHEDCEYCLYARNLEGLGG